MDINKFNAVSAREREILTGRYPNLLRCGTDIVDGARAITESLEAAGKLLACGNGGSAADADHIVGELVKSFRVPRPLDAGFSESLVSVDPELGSFLSRRLEKGLPGISLTHHPALSTAFANDVDPACVFAQQVSVLGLPGDVLVALSTSGNSRNVVLAAVGARAKGLNVVSMTGRDGGDLNRFSDVCIRVPETETFKVQELHLAIYHEVCIIIEEYFFG